MHPFLAPIEVEIEIKNTLNLDLQTKARGPNLAREAIQSSPQDHFIRTHSHFVNNEKIIYIRKIC